MRGKQRIIWALLAVLLVVFSPAKVHAQITVTAPSAILIEASTGQVIYENNATEKRSPASITKIMTMLLIFENMDKGSIALEDEVTVSAHASSMGGSQVFLAEGEVQTLETMLKCIAVASANDASVAVAEFIAGSESAFVELMNAKAAQLGMLDTHFEDCCGLTDSDNHYTTARDVAIMSRELITKYPEVFTYTGIWMEDFHHRTAQNTDIFTVSSTNKLLKQYDWITGLKTGSTDKAKYCISATGNKNGMELIAVVMGAPDPANRFADAAALLNYGYSICQMYVDENQEPLENISVKGGVKEAVPLAYEGPFHYLDTAKSNLAAVEKTIELPEELAAPLQVGQQAGQAVYRLDGKVIGTVPILVKEDVEKAVYKDYLNKIFRLFFWGE